MATAISTGTYTERIERAQGEMAQQGIDYLFIAPSSDLVYLLGYPAHTSERLTTLVIPREGRASVVVPKLEAPRLDNRRDLVELQVWDETVDPVQLLCRSLGDLPGKTIGVSDQLWAGFLLKMMDACRGARFVNADAVVKVLRVIKTPEEIGYMREAGRRTDDVWEEFIATVKMAGRTEVEVARDLTAIMLRHGLGDPAFMIVASGPGSASPHYHTSERRIAEGDAVVFDFGGNIEGYKSDITRTVHVGEPSEEFRKVYAIVDEARRAAFAAVRPGATCENVDQAARDVITQAGYGEHFIHRVGHGLGLDVHEEPYLVGGNTEQLREGMCFSDEPGIYLPGKFGIRIEDAVVCTTEGGEFLNNATHELVVMA